MIDLNTKAGSILYGMYWNIFHHSKLMIYRRALLPEQSVPPLLVLSPASPGVFDGQSIFQLTTFGF